jgi:hypothetical protein
VLINKYLITLTNQELALCQVEAQARVERAIANNYQHREKKTVPKNDPYNVIGNYRGRVTELAVAKYFDCDYEPDGPCDPTKFDLLNGCEVRSNIYGESGHLIVHKWDKPAPYVLCTLTDNANKFVIAGWRNLVDCQIDKYWRTNVLADSYWIPQNDLHDMAILKQRLSV